jgi:hypothetical protein
VSCTSSFTRIGSEKVPDGKIWEIARTSHSKGAQVQKKLKQGYGGRLARDRRQFDQYRSVPGTDKKLIEIGAGNHQKGKEKDEERRPPGRNPRAGFRTSTLFDSQFAPESS